LRERSRTRWASALAARGVGLLLAAWLWLPAAAAADRGADGEWSERRSSHFVLLQDVDIDRRGGFHGSLRFERRVLEALEDAYDRLGDRLGLRPERPIAVHVYDAGVFDATFAGVFRFPVAGFYGGVIRVRGDTDLTAGLVRVLHHELVHAAFDALAPSLVLPAWFNEGVAEWFEARALGKRRIAPAEHAALRRAADAGALFGMAELSAPSFAGFGPDAVGLAYLESYGWIDYLARRHGERRLREWVREVVRTRRLDRPFRRKFRFDLAELPERFAADL
jgi:hypothetical protein